MHPGTARQRRLLARLAFLAAAAAVCSSSVAGEHSPPKIVLSPTPSPQASFEVQGLSPGILTELKKLPRDDARWLPILSVSVVAAAGKTDDGPPMLGSHECTGDVVRFKPRFPLEPGLEYRVVFEWPNGSGPSATRARFARTFLIPVRSSEKRAAPTRVVGVYPSAAELPENVLRMYVQFSAPMSQGDSYRHVHLVDEAGTEIRQPFLELPQELWSPDGTRLTLLFEPGRVKRGLVPRTELGPILTAGHNYTLTIDGNWLDAQGRPLHGTRATEKKFRAAKADMTQPDPRTWKIEPPRAGTREPLTVHFPKPLDWGMLQRVLRVFHVDETVATQVGRLELDGDVRVTDGETRWHFTPRENWRTGSFFLSVSTRLEDPAGNSIGRPFEVDLNQPHRQPPTQPTRLELPFRTRTLL